MTPAIVVDGVTKTYRRRPDRSYAVKEAVLRRARGRRGAAPRTIAALRDVSFTVPRGRTVGIVGPNGAGKSTLLRLVGGVGRPDTGRIDVDGRIAALLELGAAFHPELSGREATVLAGIVAGLTRREVVARMDDIVAFAGLEAFVDQPLRTYSTGMQARLGFSIASHTDPEVLLVDEVLSVGDAGFQRRCVERLREFQRTGVTMLVVSHDHTLVADLCDEVVWLRGGTVAAVGAPDEVVTRYLDAVQRETVESTPESVQDDATAGLRPRVNRFGSFAGRITAVALRDRFGSPSRVLEPGDALAVVVEVDLPDDDGDPMLSVTITRDDGVLVLDTSTAVTGTGAGRARLLLERFDAAPGRYTLTPSLYAPGWGALWDLHERAYGFTVSGEPNRGALAPPLAWERESEAAAGRWITGWGA